MALRIADKVERPGDGLTKQIIPGAPGHVACDDGTEQFGGVIGRVDRSNSATIDAVAELSVMVEFWIRVSVIDA